MAAHEESLRILAEHETWLPIDNLRRKQCRRKKLGTLLIVVPVLLSTTAIALLYGHDLWAQVTSLQLDVVVAQWFAGIAQTIASTVTARIAAASVLLALSGLLLWSGLRLRRKMHADNIDFLVGEVDSPDLDQVQLPKKSHRLWSGGINQRLRAVFGRFRPRLRTKKKNTEFHPEQ